ncbi:hypothetical protein F8C67_10850 [Phaeocystidibacter luteus]|uniref:Uncharacterized protein n=1 Tax=Phaeocystidibacter luteus TaxID=911197 RepID=A0A6N6RG76_9FLAO|nr:hypothetical protein F8C67_10850 [Phaeocystidibacter luteus]
MSFQNQLHTRPNGVWSLRWAELNKRIFFSAYLNRIDDVAIRRALMEAKTFLQTNSSESDEESDLQKRWNANPPKSLHEMKWWIAVHQKHLFLPDEMRGSLLRAFPAIRKGDQRPDYKLTKLFYERLKSFVDGI